MVSGEIPEQAFSILPHETPRPFISVSDRIATSDWEPMARILDNGRYAEEETLP